MTRRWISALIAAGWAAGSAWAADWAAPEAALRFRFELGAAPSEPAAGYLAFLPDGGLLPGPAPRLRVVDDAGKDVAFEYLWHNPREGLAIVAAKPATGNALTIYAGSQARIERPRGGTLKAGPLLFTRVGGASLDEAQRVASAPLPGADCKMRQVDQIGHQENPFGADDDYLSYYSAWLKAPAAGSYQVCTISDEGSACRIDGRVVAEWPGIHTRAAGARGQFGGRVDLAAGAHHIEYFHFEATGPQEAQVCWKKPGADSEALPELIPASAYLHSGTTKLAGAAARDGRPLAVPDIRPVSYLWFGEVPMNLYECEALFAPASTDAPPARWDFGGGLTLATNRVAWLFAGNGPAPVMLSAGQGSKASTCARQVELERTPPRATVESAAHRQQYRAALLNRVRAAPPRRRPCEFWNPDLWETLLNVVEPYKGGALLEALFERSREDVARLPADDRAYLEDLYFEVLRYTDRDRALAWLDRVDREEKDRTRRLEWILARIDLLLGDAEDYEKARQAVASLQALGSGTPFLILAQVRLGDIERAQGRIDEARACYAHAQDMPRPAASAGAGFVLPARTERFGSGLARNREETEQMRTEREARRAPARPAAGQPRAPDPWKAEAVRAGAYFETVQDLIRKGFLFEARASLRDWEFETPMAKLAGDYPVAEAGYFIAIGDWKRALRILQTFRAGVDVSAFLPEAMAMELDCLVHLGRNDEARTVSENVLKRFPGHPAAARARDLLRVLGQPARAPAAGTGPAVNPMEKP